MDIGFFINDRIPHLLNHANLGIESLKFTTYNPDSVSKNPKSIRLCKNYPVIAGLATANTLSFFGLVV